MKYGADIGLVAIKLWSDGERMAILYRGMGNFHNVAEQAVGSRYKLIINLKVRDYFYGIPGSLKCIVKCK